MTQERGRNAENMLNLPKDGHPRQLGSLLRLASLGDEHNGIAKVPSSCESKPWTKPVIPISGLSSIQSVKRRGSWSVVVQHRMGAKIGGA